MEDKRVGACIAALRQGMGATQESLAQAVGVSAQAVSKWECGGLPDAALLPDIADFLGVPIDRLYGREGGGGDFYETLRLRVAGRWKNHAQRMMEGMRICYELQKSLSGNFGNSVGIEEVWEHRPVGHAHAQNLLDGGISLMSVTANAPYFMLLTDPPEGWENGLFDAEDYTELFRVLGGEHVMQALFFLLRRSGQKPFTPRFLEKSLKITQEQATDVLESLVRYKLVSTAQAELDDTVQTIYNFEPNPGLLAMLAVGKEVVLKPGCFCGYFGNREQPYFGGN